jgi:SAM-dependent methyltransferase
VSEYGADRAAYTATRRTDPRIAAAIERALGDARSVVNVGAGAGSYEPRDREVVAVEPSATMRAQRPAELPEAVDARAEALPLGDDSVDAAMAILTVHHWREPLLGLAELRRVARRRVVVLTYDAEQDEPMWLVRDYLPEIAVLDRVRFPLVETITRALGGEARVEPVPIAHDCRDGFLGGYWRRPERYLDPDAKAGISPFAELDRELVDAALARLHADLDSGAWHERHRDLLALDELDLGYRLVTAEFAAA